MQPITEPGQRHLLNQVVHFSQALHSEGVLVNSANLVDFCRSLSFIHIGNKDDFYAAARATLVSSQAEIPVFDRVFQEFWGPPDETIEEPVTEEDEASGPEPGSDEDRESPEPGQEEYEGEDTHADPDDVVGSYSPYEILVKKNFEKMSEKEIEQARILLKELVALLANDRSRRRIASFRGKEINPRRMLRENALYGADSVKLMYRKRKIKKTRLLLLCDVSGSMERYSRFLIQFIYAMRQQLASLDVAVFSTRMTVITDSLRRRNVDESLAEVAEVVHDWAGGTDIGRSLDEFNHRFAHDLDHRRTVVIILSDGWDRGDAEHMRRGMEYLYQRAYKLMWLNPLLGNPGYHPMCRGMQTALPFIDYFMSAHNLESLSDLVRVLRTIVRK